MVKFCVLAVLFAVFSSTFASHSPVLIFKNKGNTNQFPKSERPSTLTVDQREFEDRLNKLDAKQKVVFCVARDLSPEAFATRNDENTRAFENIATKVDLLEYIPNVENPTKNKITKAAIRVSVSPSNELEPKPSENKKHIIASLPPIRDGEQDFHYLARIDRACFDISQQDEYKDAIFVLTSDDNSRLQSHLRKTRDTNGQKANVKGVLKKDAHFLVYFTQFGEKKVEGDVWKNTSIAITESEISGGLQDGTIKIDFKSKLTLEFKLDTETGYWHLTSATPQDPKQMPTEMSAPANFSYSCASSLFFPTADKVGIYFNDFQIQLDFNGNAPTQFNDSYDCVGFTSAAIWSSLFITFLLLTIVGIGITLIMDIRTMDRFDDPKGKTITVAATD